MHVYSDTNSVKSYIHVNSYHNRSCPSYIILLTVIACPLLLASFCPVQYSQTLIQSFLLTAVTSVILENCLHSLFFSICLRFPLVCPKKTILLCGKEQLTCGCSPVCLWLQHLLLCNKTSKPGSPLIVCLWLQNLCWF